MRLRTAVLCSQPQAKQGPHSQGGTLPAPHLPLSCWAILGKELASVSGCEHVQRVRVCEPRPRLGEANRPAQGFKRAY